MPNKPVSFTVKYDGLVNVLKSSVKIHAAFDPSKGPPFPAHKEFEAIWDTGASATVITKHVADACGLKPIGLVKVHTARGPSIVNVYLINVLLPNGLGVHSIRVTEGILSENINVLIGMDIISRGDMAITNYEKKTSFSFRFPSTERIDFVKESRNKDKQKFPRTKGSAPCPCGSGKKFKNCCRNKQKK